MRAPTEFTNPELSGFQPLHTYYVRSIGHMCLEHESGIRLELSADGLAAAEHPGLRAVLAEMSTFIAEHGGYDKPELVLSNQAVQGVTLSRPRPNDDSPSELPSGVATDEERNKSLHLHSVYHSLVAPEHIIKAYDGGPKLAGVQFYIGSWLHKKLADANGGVYFPRQLALLTAPGGHRSIIMEHIEGECLYDISKRLHDDKHLGSATSYYVNSIRDHIRRVAYLVLGERGVLTMNDLRNTENIIINTSEPIDPEQPLDRRIAVIDQPVTAEPLTMLRHSLARRSSKQKWQPSEALKAIPEASGAAA